MNATQLLAYIAQALPIDMLLDAPVGHLRREVRHVADVLTGPLGPDATLAATVAPILDVAGQGYGTTRSPYRTQVLRAVGTVTATIAFHITQENPL